MDWIGFYVENISWFQNMST